MTKYVVIATANRGAVGPYEPLDDADQWRANQQARIEDASDADTLRHRATMRFQVERDSYLLDAELNRLKQPEGWRTA